MKDTLNKDSFVEQHSDTNASIKKLQWQCRRGMLELDVILIPFLNEHFRTLNIAQQEAFSVILKESDPDLYTWIMGFGQCQNQDFVEILQLIRARMSVA